VQLLDDVQRDILLYRCSKRTYLEMLYEAGRTLCAMDKHIRAYASYLRPCFVRAKGRNFNKYVILARKRSDTVLTTVRKAYADSDSEAWDSTIDSTKQEEEKHANKEKLGSEGFFNVDPLFGYYISGSQDGIERFRTLDGVAYEECFMGLNFQDGQAPLALCFDPRGKCRRKKLVG
ncbi:MAG: hypothetical protein QF767_01380, partial [Alphaproteobacteria bacterium]|nr:hypothetical protein [Alphaproteobacteria bacterium]